MRGRTLPTLLMAAVMVLLACEGPVGPEGPRGADGEPGPQGETGLQGPPGADGEDLTTIMRAGQLNAAGEGAASLPPEAGSIDDPPVVACYLSDSPNGPWLLIASDPSSGISCGIVQNGSGVAIALVGGPPNWYYTFVAAYSEG